MTLLATPNVEPSEKADVDVTSKGILHRLSRRVSFWITSLYLAVVVAATITAPLIAPYNPDNSNLLDISQNPTWSHLLGTDELGRDVLSRLIFGGRVTLLGALEAVATFVIIGIPLGIVAGYLNPRIDRLVMSAIDVVLSLPVIILLLVVGAVTTGNFALMVTLGIIASPGIVRVVRAATLAVRAELYVKAAEVVGLSRVQVLRRHILPRILGPALVQISVFAAAAVVIESTLGFLGLDVSPPAPSWGSMVAEGATQINQQPWLIIPSGLAITLTVLAIGILGDNIRDATSPRTVAVQPRSILKLERKSHAEALAKASTDHQREASSERSDALIVVRNLVVALRTSRGRQVIVDRASFDVRRGETLGIVGESGSGKTITILALLGLLPPGLEIVSGSITFEGREMTSRSSRPWSGLRGKTISFVSQEPMLALDPGHSVGSQLREALRRNRGLSRRGSRMAAIELLGRVELPNPTGVARKFPHELSGGMAQRVCVALALTGEPKLMIADEPTTALDVTVQAEILDLLRSIREQTGMALILVSHDWGVIADSCDRTVVMYAGQVVEYAAVQDLFSDPKHPYTEGLLAANPHSTTDGPFPSIPGGVPSPAEWPSGCRFQPRCSYAQSDCVGQYVEVVSIGGTRQSRCLHYENVGEVSIHESH